MNTIKKLLYGFITAVATAILLGINNIYWQNETVIYFIYIILPLLLCLFLVKSISRLKDFIEVLLPLTSYWVLVSIFELFVYKYWKFYETPAGDIYSKYDLDAIYPFFGIFIILIVFIISILARLIFILSKRVYSLYKIDEN